VTEPAIADYVASNLLEGKVALVTGGGRGLGRSMALALAEAGADIVAGARSKDQLDQLAAAVVAVGRRCSVRATDVTSTDDVDALIRQATAEFGRLDIVVNNAGISQASPLLDCSDEDWDAVIGTNLKGTFLVLRAAGRVLVEQGSGKVINIASNFAFRGVEGFGAYCASKAAIVNLTRVAAVEWARHGVQVNALAPGYFATEFNQAARDDEAMLGRILRKIPLRRMGEPDELGRWVVMLGSPASDFLTGEVIVIDGGQSAH
jgi:NAD(P)-dependent dehydrogenase (short-subunit alcohol dehydrogenase family)